LFKGAYTPWDYKPEPKVEWEVRRPSSADRNGMK
jgi:hypothetical protein